MLLFVPWRGHNGYFCHGCGKHRSECGPLSARYKCERCGNGRAIAAKYQLKKRAGPHYEHWRERSLAALNRLVHSEARQ